MTKQTGIELIAQERKEQIEKHGHTTFADTHTYTDDIKNDLCYAAAAYVLPDVLKTSWQKTTLGHRSNLFPWDESHWKPSPNDRIKELCKAGALIAAEIDRIQALEEQQS